MRGIEPLSAAWDCYWKEFADYATNMTFFLTELLCSLCTTSPYRVRDGLEPPTTSLAWNERLLFGPQAWSIFSFVLYQLSYLTHVIGASSWFVRTFAPSPWMERDGFEPSMKQAPSCNILPSTPRTWRIVHNCRVYRSATSPYSVFNTEIRMSCGGWIWTNDLRGMNPASYHCSTPP